MKRVLALVFVLTVIGTGVALATPGTGSTSLELARRTVHRIKIDTSGTDVVVARNTYDPGGTSGWHSHPGKVVIGVESGAITIYRGDDATCTGTTYTAGEAFVESPSKVYFGRNESTTVTAVLTAVFFNVPVAGSARIDQPDPGNCSF
jgi:quercetin dioxygenase-like cupin family protein